MINPRIELLKSRIRGFAYEEQCGDISTKHLKMAESPWLFFRGSAELFYGDIAEGCLSLLSPDRLNLPTTMIMGDCHLSNFGLFSEESAYGDEVIFAPNDFDDACLGHGVWDIFRFICSLFIQQNNDEAAHGLAQHFIESYLLTLAEVVEDAAYRAMAITRKQSPKCFLPEFKKAEKRAADGEKFLTKSSLAKAVDLETLPLRFKNEEKYQRLTSVQQDELHGFFQPYMNDCIIDCARRHQAGTGSLDLDRYYLLIGPRTIADKSDLGLCYITEVKQQRVAAPLLYFSGLHHNNKLSAAELSVYCQRTMQRNPDLILNAVTWNNKEWLVRSRHHMRFSVKPEKLQEKDKRYLQTYAALCGKTLALAHSRGDRRSTYYEKAMMTYLKEHATQLQGAACDYSQQIIADWRLFREYLVKGVA